MRKIIYMLFRTSEGKLIEIRKYSFQTDALYYAKILEVKKSLPKLEKCFNNKNNKQTNE
jgi:hypothetical protein